MTDPQDLPDSEPDAGTPAQKQPPEKAAKAPAKKAPAKKAPGKHAVAKKAPAKKAPAKKAPAKKAEAKPLSEAVLEAPKSAEPPVEKPAVQHRAETNGQLAAAKDVAAQAKSTVESAKDALPREASAASPLQSPVPLVVAITLSLLALLLVRQLRRR
jgi:hypothetical protein